MLNRNDHAVIGHRRKHCRRPSPHATLIQYAPVLHTRPAVSLPGLVKYCVLFHALPFISHIAAREIKRNKVIDINSRVLPLTEVSSLTWRNAIRGGRGILDRAISG